MFYKTLAAMFIPLFISTAAIAAPPGAARADTQEKSSKLSEAFSTLHAVSQWSITLSEKADQRAKSDLVKNYAREMATANQKLNDKLRSVAENGGFSIAPLDPQTEDGKSLLDRIKAETVLLDSLEGDAFDKEYMTLVTNTQQSVIHHLNATKASAKTPEAKQFLAEMTTTVQKRLKTSQDIMAKIYGNEI